jgi:hypothetical protein
MPDSRCSAVTLDFQHDQLLGTGRPFSNPSPEPDRVHQYVLSASLTVISPVSSPPYFDDCSQRIGASRIEASNGKR